MKLGIIDIGSNSIRLVILDIQGTSYRITDQIKHSARLGQDMSADGYLDQKRMDYAIQVLAHFAVTMHTKGVREVLCVATEAVRRAKNQNQFLSRARKALGTEVRILSGREEAYYDYLGCVNTLDIKHALAFDIGGSSTELILIRNRLLVESVSLRLGSIPLMEMFDLSAKATDQQIERLKVFLIDQFKMLPWLSQAKGLPLIGIGGSVRTTGKIDRLRKSQGEFIAHNYSLDRNDLHEIASLVVNWKNHSGQRPRGLPRDRDDIYTGSLILIKTLADYLGSEKLFVSGAGVRDGILFEYLLGNRKFVPDVLEFSLRNIIQNHMSEDYDGEDLWQITEPLFDQLSSLEPEIRHMKKVMKTTTFLHDIGKNINFFQRDRNTFYSILNAPIHGLSQKQILLAACSATSGSSDDILKEYLGKRLLTQRDIRVIRKLGLILKLAKAISYASASNPAPLEMNLTKSKLEIYLPDQITIQFAREDFSFHSHEFRSSFGVALDFFQKKNPLPKNAGH